MGNNDVAKYRNFIYNLSLLFEKVGELRLNPLD